MQLSWNLLVFTFSTCFGHHYAYRQEYKIEWVPHMVFCTVTREYRHAMRLVYPTIVCVCVLHVCIQVYWVSMYVVWVWCRVSSVCSGGKGMVLDNENIPGCVDVIRCWGGLFVHSAGCGYSTSQDMWGGRGRKSQQRAWTGGWAYRGTVRKWVCPLYGKTMKRHSCGSNREECWRGLKRVIVLSIRLYLCWLMWG
jgi:hypothetical protein